jgi:hypothetical protein
VQHGKFGGTVLTEIDGVVCLPAERVKRSRGAARVRRERK